MAVLIYPDVSSQWHCVAYRHSQNQIHQGMKMNYWQPKLELMDRAELEELQLRRLKSTVEKVYKNVPFYHNKFKEAGITPEDIQSLKDLSKLPTTRKANLRENYPFGLFAVPRDEVVRVHASSGTTGKPTVVGYTAKDIETWSDMMARDFVMVGVKKGDVFQNAVNYGFFTGGLGVHYGIERMGAMAVPSGVGNTERQLEIMMDFGVTVLHCTPSYALYLAETAKAKGVAGQVEAEDWLLWSRALVGRIQKGAGRSFAYQSLRFLRALGDDGTGRGLRVPGAKRPAHLGGSLPCGDPGRK